MSIAMTVPRSRAVAGRYNAFISYAHADDVVARALQRALHDFARPWYRLRALRIFLDDASLSATTGLRRDLEAALDDASYLVLLASPRAAESTWVAREVQYWRDNKDMDRLLIALTDGEIVWDEASRDFDWTRTSALPMVLRGAFREEPLYTDLRHCRGADDRAMQRDARFRLRVADIAAPLHGTPKDALIGDDVRFHRRVVTLVRATVATLVAVVVALALLANVAIAQRARAVEQRDAAKRAQQEAANEKSIAEDALLQAEEERKRAELSATLAKQQEAEAQRAQQHAQRQEVAARSAEETANTERAVADEARRLASVQRDAAIRARNLALARLLAAEAVQLPDEDLDTALLLAVRAVRTLDISATRDALTSVVHRTERIVAMARAEGTIGAVAFSAERSRLAMVDYGKGERSAKIRVWNVAQRVAMWSANVDQVPADLVFVERTGEVATFGRKGIAFFDATTGAARGSVPLSFGYFPPTTTTSADGRVLTYLLGRNGVTTLVAWDLATRRQVPRLRVTSTRENAPRIALSPRAKYLAVQDDGISVYRVADGVRMEVTAPVEGELVAVSDTGRVATLAGNHLFVWSASRGFALSRSGRIGIIPSAGADPVVEFDLRGERLAVTVGASTRIWRWAGSDAVRRGPDWRPRLMSYATTVHVLGPARRQRNLTYRLAHPNDTSIYEEVMVTAVAPDRVFVADPHGGALLDAASAKVLRTYPSMPYSVVDDRVRAAVYHSPKGESVVVSTDGGRTARSLPGLKGAAALALSGNGRVLAAALPGEGRGQGVIVLRDLVTGRTIARLPGWDGGRVSLGGLMSRALAISRDGRTVAYANRDGVAVWQGGQIRTMPGADDTFLVIEMSPDGRRVAHNNRDAVIDVFDTTTMTVLGRLRTGPVWDIAFTPNPNVIATVGEQTAIWDVSTFERRTVVYAAGSDWARVTVVGDTLVAGNGTSTVGFFSLDIENVVRAACSLVGRSLNDVETNQYLGGVDGPAICGSLQ